MPRCFGASTLVRASRIAKSHRCAFDVHTFCPFTTNSSPSRSARVARLARSLPGDRLAEQLAPDFVGAEQRPEVARLLLVGAVAQEHRTDHPDGRRDEAGAHRELGLLLREDRGLRGRAAPPAVLGRPRDAGPPAVEQLLLPGATRVEVLAGGGAGVEAGSHRGCVLLEPGPRLGSKLVVGGHWAKSERRRSGA